MTPDSEQGVTDAVSDERLAELLSAWERESSAMQSHDLDSSFADEHVSALRELIALRRQLREAVPALEAGAEGLTQIRSLALGMGAPYEEKERDLADVVEYATKLRALASKGKGV